MSKLDSVVVGGIYQYIRKDNGEVVYRGHTTHSENRFGTILENVDSWHRQGERFKSKFKYSWTAFRSNLRRPFGDKVTIEWCVEPQEMTFKELLELEGKMIREGHDKGQCYLNHDPDPLASWKKFNG